MLARINSALLDLLKPLSASVDQNKERGQNPEQRDSKQKQKEAEAQVDGSLSLSKKENIKIAVPQLTLVPAGGLSSKQLLENKAGKPENTRLLIEIIATYQALRNSLTQVIGRKVYRNQSKQKSQGKKIKKGAILDDKVE